MILIIFLILFGLESDRRMEQYMRVLIHHGIQGTLVTSLDDSANDIFVKLELNRE